MAWLLLIIAGLCEIVWAVGLKEAIGFTRPWVTVITVVAMIASVVLLGIAMKSLPVGTSYAIWVGVGAVGTAAGFRLVEAVGGRRVPLAASRGCAPHRRGRRYDPRL